MSPLSFIGRKCSPTETYDETKGLERPTLKALGGEPPRSSLRVATNATERFEVPPKEAAGEPMSAKVEPQYAKGMRKEKSVRTRRA